MLHTKVFHFFIIGCGCSRCPMSALNFVHQTISFLTCANKHHMLWWRECVCRKERWLASPLTGTRTAFGLTCYLHIWLRLPTLWGGSITQFKTYPKKKGTIRGTDRLTRDSDQLASHNFITKGTDNAQSHRPSSNKKL